MSVSWNNQIVRAPGAQASQRRTISAWGASRQRDIARTRVLVVGAGSVGLDVVQRLAATGLAEIGIMDFDRIDEINRDRMVGATRRDARLRRKKVDVANRLARSAATADQIQVHAYDTSICSPEGCRPPSTTTSSSPASTGPGHAPYSTLWLSLISSR